MKVKKKDYGLYAMYYLLDNEGIGKPLGRLEIQIFKRLLPVFEEKKWEQDLKDYLIRDIQIFINCCLRDEWYDILENMLNNDVLPVQEVDKAIEKAIKGKKYEAQVMLMDYKQRVGGYGNESKNEDRFKL